MKPAISLATNSKANMVIQYGEFEEAGEILARYLNQITGGEYKLYKVNAPGLRVNFVKADCGVDGFRYSTADMMMTFEATDERAAVFAVYDFLERITGCRFYTADYEYVPKNANLSVQFEDYGFTPKIQYREIYYRDFANKDFAKKRKAYASPLSGADNSSDESHENWGFWCHSFETLCSPEEYFDKHPEYFSLRNGERIGKGAQLCLTNPEVLEVVCANLKKYIDKNPKLKYWSVSQNDNDAYCQCEKCQALNEKEGGPMGSVLPFVNEVAKQFPDNVISTLAYWYTRKPPKSVRPADNVHIMLCNIEANRGLPIETDELSKDSKEELIAWKDICQNVFLWDYNIQFRNLVSPFPNFNTLAPNMRFFAENNVTALFSQCNRERGGEFSELRGYMLAKLAWDPYLDPDEIMKEFVYGYYHQGGEFILQYIKLLHENNKSGKLSIFGGPTDGMDSYLSEKNVKQYFALFDKALKATEHDEKAREHVLTARLPLLYAVISLKYGTRDEKLAYVAEFAAQAQKSGLEMVEEWKITAEKFIAEAAASIN